jgi:hypothetical protein
MNTGAEPGPKSTGSQAHPREGLRRLHALELPDLRHDGPDRVERFLLDLRDQVVFPEEWIQLDDSVELEEPLVDLLLPGWFDVDEDETDGRSGT